MEPLEKDLLENLKGNKKFTSGKVAIDARSYYFNAVEGPPLVINPTTSQVIGGVLTEFPTIILLGFNDFISSYETAFRYRERTTSGELVGLLNQGIQFNPKANLVITSENQSFFNITFPNTGTTVQIQSQLYANGIAKNGDVVIVQRVTNVPIGIVFFKYLWVETLIRCKELPTVSLIELCNTGNVTMSYFKIDFLEPIIQNFGDTTPIQKTIPIIFIKQNIWGKTNLDTITPSTFITEESFQPEVADIPIYIPLKNITIQTSKNFKYDLLRFTLNIKIKN